MSIRVKDVLDAIDHRSRQVREGEMGLWVRVSEWELIRDAMRHSPSEADQLDAARYRWLRVNSTKPIEPWSTHSPESFDKMVDTEIQRRPISEGSK